MGRRDELEKRPTEELENALARGGFGSDSDLNPEYRQVQLILERRRREKEEAKFERVYKQSEQNVSSTKNLVKATWALVLVTLLLVVITAIIFFTK